MSEFKIHIPEGKEICLESSSLEEGVIVFKNKEQHWENFKRVTGYYINSHSNILEYFDRKGIPQNRNTFPSFVEAKAALALSQLLQWRNRVWKKFQDISELRIDLPHYVIIPCTNSKNGVVIEKIKDYPRVLRFSEEWMAEEFLESHKKLILQAIPLL